MGNFIFLLTLLVGTFVESHQSKKIGTWTAGSKMLANPDPRANNYSLPEKQFMNAIKLPREFDARDHWPHCPSIGKIIDQGSCSSCWANVAATTMADRVCIHSGGKVNHKFSAMDIMSCCSKCGIGCTGGNPEAAWQHWVEQGIVSGGPYGSREGCAPYRYAPCEHGAIGDRSECISPDYLSIPKCTHTCVKTFNGTYESDKNYGASAYSIGRNEAHMRQEIFTNGPIISGMALFEDILYYKKGVYMHLLGEFIGAHAVRIIGWGVEDGWPYWLAANTWNTDWGDKGFFKILRGYNHCEIEERISAGLPK